MKSSILDILEIEAPASDVWTDELKKMVLLMVAIGEPISQVAGKFKLKVEQVENLVKSRDGTEAILRMQTALFPDAQVRLKKLAHIAIDQQLRLMLTAKNEGVRAKIASDMLDRSVGKAVQAVENKNQAMADMDLASADRALLAQEERLARLEATQKQLLAAQLKTNAS
jgi:hypothetical protein